MASYAGIAGPSPSVRVAIVPSAAELSSSDGVRPREDLDRADRRATGVGVRGERLLLAANAEEGKPVRPLRAEHGRRLRALPGEGLRLLRPTSSRRTATAAVSDGGRVVFLPRSRAEARPGPRAR